MDPYMKERFYQFVKCLNDAHCENAVVICGSWAEYLYQESGLLQHFQPMLKTKDVDIYIPDLHVPHAKADLPSLAKEINFKVASDYVTGQTKFVDQGGDFEIEFLTRQIGNFDMSNSRSNIGVKPQALTHMDMLGRYTHGVHTRFGDVLVPWPEAYTLHKMIINPRRGEKMIADQEKIAYIAPFLDPQKYEEVADSLTKKELKQALAYVSIHKPDLFAIKEAMLELDGPIIQELSQPKDIDLGWEPADGPITDSWYE